MDLRKLLEKLGYPVYHSNILICLIETENFATAKEISACSKVPLSRVYSILLELEKKGLVNIIPGKKTKYTLVDKKKFLQQVGKEKSLELKKQKKKMEEALQLLDKQVDIALKSPRVAVRHFHNIQKYKEVYDSEFSKMGKKDKFRVINGYRWLLSYLPEEVEKSQKKKRILNLIQKLEKGMKIYHLTDPKSIVKKIKKELKTKQKILESIAQLIYYYNLPKIKNKHYVSFASNFKNIKIFIMESSVFFEFLSPIKHNVISAVQIKSKKTTKEFAQWFDTYFKKSEPKKGLKNFKKSILKSAKKIADIDSKRIEKLIKAMRPTYK